MPNWTTDDGVSLFGDDRTFAERIGVNAPKKPAHVHYEPKGTITREHTVWCGICGNWEQTAIVNTKAHAAKIFRRGGWSKTVERGWVCRNCKSGATARMNER